MPDRVPLKLFSSAVLYAGAALLAFSFLYWLLPSRLSNIEMFVPLVRASRNAAWLVASICLLIAIATSLWRYRLWYQWRDGHGPSCTRCGGLLLDRLSRGRIYQQCINCGRKSY